VARLQGNSWSPSPSIGNVVNVGTIRDRPHRSPSQGDGGQVHCRLMISGWGGGSVVLRAWESCVRGEGTQRVSSNAVVMAGDRW
jgi:hypothetical protein